jgi:hypothetical protein
MQRELERVAITAVDPESRTATGVTRIRTVLSINCAYATGDTITTPAVGEQWYIERLDMEWRLYGRIPFNDSTLNIEPEEGQVSVGSASGPLELNGTEIRANGARFRLNGAYYRDDGDTLLRSTDGDVWEPIFANATGNGTAGILQMLAHRLADIPVTPEVDEYLGELSDAETAALADLAEWADGLQETIGGGWDALCNNPFFAGLRNSGTGDEPLDQIVSGLQSFLNDLTGLLFCQFQGDVTPEALTAGFSGLQQMFAGENQTGDFLRGLQGLLPVGDQANNLLLDSVNGAVKFIQDLFDILFCTDAAVPIDPTAILTELGSIFDPLKNNKFLLGLQEVFTDAGNAATNLFTDAIEGTVTVIEQLFSALFCDFDYDPDNFTPKMVFDQLQNSIIAPLRDNPVIKNLTEFAEKMSDQIGSSPNLVFDGQFNFSNIDRFAVNPSQVSGYSSPPRDSRHKLFTFAGTATPDLSMFQAMTGIDVDPELWEWVPVIYPHWFPVSTSVETGVRNCIEEINAWPGKFGLSGYSQGAIVCSSVLWELRYGSLQHRYDDLIGAVMFGNPKREAGITFPGGIDPGGAGMAPDIGGPNGRIQDTPDFWWEFANHNADDPANGLYAIPGSLGSDPFTVNPLNEAGEWITAIYQFMLQEFNGSEFDLLPRLQELFSSQILSSVSNAIQSIIHLFKGFGVGHMEYANSRPLPGSDLNSVELGVQHLNVVGAANPLTPQLSGSSVGRAWFWDHISGTKCGLKLAPNAQVQHFIVDPGDIYYLEGEVMPYGGNSLSSGAIQIGATFTDTTNTQPTTEVFFDYPLDSADMALGKWNTVKTSVTIPAGYNRATFSIRSTDDTQEGDKFWADNVSVRRNANIHPIVAPIEGLVEVVQTIFGLLTCDLPQAKIDNLDEFISQATGGFITNMLDFLQNRLFRPLQGSFVQGLADMFRASQTFNRSLLEDAIAGAEQFIEVVQDIFTCNVDGTLIQNIKDLVGPDAIGVTPAKIVKLLDEFFGTFRDNPFVLGLQQFWTTLGNQATTVAQDAVQGATEFLQYIFDLILCKPNAGANLTAIKGLAGTSFTPARIVADVEDFLDNFRNNDFLKGLQDFWVTLGNNTENFLQDAIKGATGFVQFLFDLVTCNVQPGQLADVLGLADSELSGFTPAGLIRNIEDFFDGFRSNPFVTGLQDIWTSLGNTTHGLLRDVADGVTEFFQVIFGALNCDTSQLLKLNTLAGSAAASSATPVGILASLKQTFTGGDGSGGLLGNTWVQIFNGIANRQGFTGNLLNKLTDGFAQVADFFLDILDNLFPSIDFRTIITGFPDGFPTALPTLQEWLEDLNLSKLLDPFNLGGWFQDNIFRPVLKSLTGLDDAQLDALIQNPLANIGIFFTNIRKFFGEGLIGNWLNSFGGGLLNGSFNPLTALQSFISDVLVEGIETLWETLVGGLTSASNNLVKALTGQDIDGILGDGLRAIKDFFSGFGEFNPATGANPLMAQLVKRITGDDGKFTLDDLANFFDPTFVSNIFKDIVEAITTSTTNFLSGPLKALADFFDFNKNAIGGGGIFGGLPTLLNTIVETMIGPNVLSGSGPLAKLSQLFTGVSLTGGKSLMTQVIDQVNYIAEVLGLNSIVASITGTDINELENSYTLTFGGSPTGGSFTLTYGGQTTAAIPYSTTATTTADSIDAALDALTSIDGGSTVTFASGKYTVSLDNTDGTLALGTASLTGGTSPTLAVAQKFRGSLDALGQFFTGFNPFTGSSGTNLLQQILTQAGSDITEFVSKITGIPVASLTNPLAAVQQFFSGFTDIFNPANGDNNLIAQIVSKIIPNGSTLGQLDTFFTNLFGLFGLNGTNPLADILSGDFLTAGNKLADAASRFVNSFLSKAGTGTITNLAKIPGNILNIGITNIENLISTLTGGTSLTQFANFFANLRKFLNIGTSGTDVINFFGDPASFSIPNAVNGFIKNIIKTATAIGEIPATLISAFSPAKISGLIEALTGKTTGVIEADLNTFFANLRTTLNLGTGVGQINLLDPAATLSTLRTNFFNFVSGLTSGLNSFITKSGLGTWLGATGTEINNFFTNLTSFFKIGEFKLAPGTFDIGIAAGNFIKDIINQATGFLINPLKVLGIGGAGTTLSTDLSNRPVLNTLLGWVTGTGTTNALDTFFTNIKNLFGGNINLLGTTFNASTAQQNLLSIINTANQTVEAFISKSGLQSWLGATTLTEIGNFFQNITKFFKIGDFKLAPTGTGAGVFNIATAAGKFIEDFINQATGFLINPLKVLGVDNATLSGDLSARPLLSTLLGWVTGTGTTNAFDNFFTNIKNLFGGNINLLGGTFNASAAQQSLVTIIANANDTVGALVKQADLALKAGIADIVERITGVGGATTLSGLSTFFAGLIPNTIAGASALLTKVVDNITSAVTGGTATLTNFFAGLGGGTATATSLVHKIVSSITGNSGSTQNLQSLGTFFGNFTSSATTLVGKVVDQITGLVTNGLAGLNLTQFFSGFNGATTATDSLAHKISQAVSGGAAATLAQVDNFFKNIRSFLGIGTTGINLSDFLGDVTAFGTKLTGIVNSFITNVLQRNGLSTTLVALQNGATQLTQALIPNLAIDKIEDLVGLLTGGIGTSKTDVDNFFKNIRTFLGGTNGFLSPTFNISAAVENFISNVLKAPSVGVKLVTTGINNLLDTGIIPPLAMDKITDLMRFLTGSTTAVVADVERFFTNLRSMFGGSANLLSSTFSFPTAAKAFIDNVLSKVSSVATKIPSLAIGDLGINQITNLISSITGITSTDNTAIQKFFSGFTGFNPATGANNLINQFTKSIFGTNGTLAQLQTFFSGLGAGFNPGTGTGNIVQQFVQQITGKVGGVLADIGSFLGIGPLADSTTFNPFTGANNLISQIVTKIVPAGSTLVDMTTFFTNFRNLFGATNFLSGTFDFPTAAKAFIDNVLSKVSSVATKIPSLAIGDMAINQITNLISSITGVISADSTAIQKFFSGFTGFNVGTGANNLINQFVTKITGNNGQTLTELNTAFTNLRNFLGFNPVSTGGAGTFNAAVTEFFTKLNSATITNNNNKLNPANLLQGIGMGQINDLNRFLTGSTTAVAADVEKFFTNLRATFGGINFLPTTTFNASAAQRAIHDFVASINTGLAAGQKWATQAVADAKATIADIVQKITGTTGATTLNPIGDFFAGLVGSGGSLINQFVSRITGTGTTLANLETTFANLRSFLGFSPLATASPAASVNSFFGTLNGITPTTALNLNTVGTNLNIEKVASLASFVTGGGATTSAGVQTFFNNLRNFLGFNPFSAGGSTTFGAAVNTFFGNLNTITPTTKLDPAKLLSSIGVTQISNLVSSLTGTGSSGTDLTTFFTNLRSTLGVNFLPGTTFNTAAAQKAIHDFVASVNAGLASGQKWATQAIADAKAGIADIVQRITGATGATDLTGLGNFFSGLVGANGSLVSQFVSRITGTGATLTDLTTTFTNLRNFLGFNPLGGFTNLANAVTSFFAKLNTVTPTTKLDPAKLLSAIGMGQISDFITFVTGSSGGTLPQIQSFFNTLRDFLGFNPASAPAFATAVTTFFTKLNTITPTTRLDPVKLFQDIGITKISNLVPFITGTGSAATDIQTFFNRLKSILGGVNPMSAASVSAESANLFTALNGAASGSLGTAKVAGIENTTLGADLRGMFSSVVLGLQGNPSSAAAGSSTPRLTDLFSTAKNTSDSISNIAQVISELQTTATQAANSGNSDFTVFPNFTLWNNGGLTYSGTASGSPASAVEAVNNQAVWKSYNGTTTRSARAVFTRTKTSTNYQRVGITFASKPMGDWGGGASPAYNYILGRANNNSGVTTEYVFAKFSPTALSIGYTLNGGASETMFQTINHSFSAGATYWLECGTSGGQAVYRVLRGSEVLLTVTNTGFNAYTNDSHRFGGFMMTGTWNGFWINEPGSMAAFAIADNTPASYLGSGFRRYRNATTQSVSSIGTGNRLLPGNFFNTADYATTDYTFNSTTGRVTVSTEGWYQVNINLALTANSLYSEMAPVLYKNGAVNARGGSVWGTAAILGGRSPVQCAGAFHVYLKAGEYIQPGYWHSTADTTGTLTGDAAGHTCYLQVTFMNRSTTA